MCSTVVYKYDCGHSVLTTYKCCHCPADKGRCNAAAREKKKRKLHLGDETSFQKTDLAEPCHLCSGEDVQSPTVAPSIFDPQQQRPTARSSDSDEPPSDAEDIYRWRAGLVRVRPLVTSRFANAVFALPRSRAELIAGIRRFLINGGSIDLPDGTLLDASRILPRL